MASGNQKLDFAIRAINEASKTIKDVQSDIGVLGGKMDAANSKASKFGSALGDVGKIAGGFVLAQGIMKAPGFLMDAANAAQADQQEWARLEQAVRNAGGAFDENIQKVRDRVKAGQDLAFTDSQVQDSFQILVAATGDVDEALQRQTLAMDLARGGNMSLEQAAKLVGKVTDENVQQFRRMGITIAAGATEAEALAAVQAKFAGQSQVYANSTAGQFEQAKIRMGELKEQLGYQLLPVFTAVAGVLLEHVIPAIEKFAEEAGPKIREFIAGVKTAWETQGKPVLDNIMAAWEKLKPVILPVLAQIQNMVETTFKVIGLTLGIIIDLLGGDFSGAWNKTKELVQTVMDYWKETIQNGVDFIKGLLPLLRELGEKLLDELWAGMKWVAMFLLAWMKGLPAQMLEAIGDLGSLLYDVGKAVIQGLIDGMKSMKDFIPDPRKWIPGAGLVGDVIEFASGVTASAAGGVSPLMDNATGANYGDFYGGGSLTQGQVYQNDAGGWGVRYPTAAGGLGGTVQVVVNMPNYLGDRHEAAQEIARELGMVFG